MRRRKIWSKLFLNLILWIGWVYFLINFPPENTGPIIIFFLLLSSALGLSLSLVFRNIRQGFLLSGVIVIFLLLRLLKMDNIVNLILLFAFFLTLELYLHR